MGSATLDVVCGRDTYLNENAPTTNYGSATTFEAGDGGGSKSTHNSRALLYFDLSSLAGKTVTAVTIDYFVESTSGTGDAANVVHALHRLTTTRQSWVEAEATWNIYKTANNWTTAGGDYDASPTKHTWTPGTGSLAKTIASSAQLVALIQDAIDNQAGACHLLWKEDADTDTTDQNQLTVRSRDHATASSRPTIHVTYTVPDVGLVERSYPRGAMRGVTRGAA